MRRSPNRRHNLSARSQSLFIKFMNATKSAKDRGLKQSQQGKRQQQRTSIIRNYYNQKSVVLCAFHLLYDYFLTLVARLTGWNDLYWGSLCKWGVHSAKHIQFFSHLKIRHQFSSLTVGRHFFLAKWLGITVKLLQTREVTLLADDLAVSFDVVRSCYV